MWNLDLTDWEIQSANTYHKHIHTNTYAKETYIRIGKSIYLFKTLRYIEFDEINNFQPIGDLA